jgi:hypothetical protein
MKYEYIGYHGTNYELVESIKKDNFKKSLNDDEWLGHGVYFFIDGISDAKNNAVEWAKNQAYEYGQYKYNKYAVIEVKIICEKILNITTQEGMKAFNILRNSLIRKHDSLFQRDRNFRCDDRIMWNLVAQVMGLEAVIHNLYIKDKVQRIRKIGSNVPNTTVMCVKTPDLIDKNSIKLICDGEVIK